MSILKSVPEKRLPQAAPMPVPQTPMVQQPRAPSPEVVSFLQRTIDDQAEIQRLRAECDGWRSRAITAEEQMKRLEMNLDREDQEHERKLATVTDHYDRVVAKTEAQRQHDIDRLTDERDRYKLAYARTRERLHVAGKLILDTLEADKKAEAEGLKAVEAMAAAIEPVKPASGNSGESSGAAPDPQF